MVCPGNFSTSCFRHNFLINSEVQSDSQRGHWGRKIDAGISATSLSSMQKAGDVTRTPPADPKNENKLQVVIYVVDDGLDAVLGVVMLPMVTSSSSAIRDLPRCRRCPIKGHPQHRHSRTVSRC